jgi:hypothetical protein
LTPAAGSRRGVAVRPPRCLLRTAPICVPYRESLVGRPPDADRVSIERMSNFPIDTTPDDFFTM